MLAARALNVNGHMKIAILSNGAGWHVRDLMCAAALLGHVAEPIDFRRIFAGIPDTTSLAHHDAVIVRTMPPGSLEQVVFRMDVLHRLEAAGRRVLNPPRALEICVDKYLANGPVWTPPGCRRRRRWCARMRKAR